LGKDNHNDPTHKITIFTLQSILPGGTPVEGDEATANVSAEPQQYLDSAALCVKKTEHTPKNNIN